MHGFGYNWKIKYSDVSKFASVYCEPHNKYAEFILNKNFPTRSKTSIRNVLAHECGHVLISEMEQEVRKQNLMLIEKTATEVGRLFLLKLRGAK